MTLYIMEPDWVLVMDEVVPIKGQRLYDRKKTSFDPHKGVAKEKQDRTNVPQKARDAHR